MTKINDIEFTKEEIQGLRNFYKYNGYLNKDTKELLSKINSNLGVIRFLIMSHLGVTEEQLSAMFSKRRNNDNDIISKKD